MLPVSISKSIPAARKSGFRGPASVCRRAGRPSASSADITRQSCSSWLGRTGRAVQPRRPHRLDTSVALIGDPADAVHVDGAAGVHRRVDRADQLVLVGVALGQTQILTARADVADDGGDRTQAVPGRRVGPTVRDTAAAAGVGLPALGQAWQPDRESQGQCVGFQGTGRVVGRHRPAVDSGRGKRAHPDHAGQDDAGHDQRGDRPEHVPAVLQQPGLSRFGRGLSEAGRSGATGRIVHLHVANVRLADDGGRLAVPRPLDLRRPQCRSRRDRHYRRP